MSTESKLAERAGRIAYTAVRSFGYKDIRPYRRLSVSTKTDIAHIAAEMMKEPVTSSYAASAIVAKHKADTQFPTQFMAVVIAVRDAFSPEKK